MLRYDSNLVKKSIDSIKVISAEAVEKAKSGHPGMPIGCADVAFLLWHYFLRFNPKDTKWLGRDVFILSAGHASMLQYSLLHLYNFGITMDDIKNFRQLNSLTPGHPEYGLTPGVETTTGPLGQGLATAVGEALARKILREKFKNKELMNSKVYCIVSDGDMMEGISGEAASIAGHLKLDNLIYIYDKNGISIEGSTNLTFTENVADKFKAFGWSVLEVNGYDHTEIIGALNTVKRHKGTPMFIIANTVIAKGCDKKEGTAASHGAPLGLEILNCLKNTLEWKEKDFTIPKEVYDFANEKILNMEEEYNIWKKDFEKEISSNSELKKYLNAENININKTEDLYKDLRSLITNKKEATRVVSGNCIQVIAKHIPNFIGGSADLAPSNNTTIKNAASISANDFNGKNLHFGIREHVMGAISNGLSLSDFIPYCATFLVFSDYMRSSIRLSALMSQGVIYVLTHDSIYVGEDGPTHQPIEHLSSLRLIPNLNVIRPGSEEETIESWIIALESRENPTALLLTRQGIGPIKDLDRKELLTNFKKGAYIALKEKEALKCVVVATGSELSLVANIREELNAESWMRIVSMPSMNLFLKQSEEYKNKLIPENCKKISVEAGSTLIWSSIIGKDGLKIGIDDFGTSAPGEMVAKEKGMDIESVKNKIKKYLNIK